MKTMRVSKTACPMDCYDSCSMIARVDDQGHVSSIEGNSEHPMTQGRLCGKGYKLLERHHSQERMLWPMKKVNGQWQRIDWDIALQEIAKEVEMSIAQYGPLSIMHSYDYGSSGILKLATDRFFNMLGGYTDVVGSLCWEAGLTAQEYDFGQPKSNDPTDIAEHSKHIVIWGRNVSVTNMHMVKYIREAQKRQATVTVINPLKTDMDAQADLIVQPKPGTDGILALAICNEIIANDRYDHIFVDKHVLGFDAFKLHVQAYDVSLAAHICGVKEEQIIQLANLYSDGPTSTLLGIGMQRYKNGGNTIRAIDALAAISGNVGVAGGGVNYAHREMSAFVDWHTLMGRSHNASRREFSRVTQANEILEADPPVDVLFISRTNLVTQVPNASLTRRALRNVRVKVLIDSYLTQTADEADYFLPVTTVFEEEDVMLISMWSSYLTYANQVVQPRGQARPDWMIFRDLARELHLPKDLEISPEVLLEEVFQPLHKHGMSLKACKEEGFLRLPIDPVAYRDRVFKTPSGKVELYSELAVAHGQSALASPGSTRLYDSADYPYALLTVHPRRQENSQAPVSHVPRKNPPIEISPQLAIDLGLVELDLVLIETNIGQLICEVKITEGMRMDVVKLEQGWTYEDQNVNMLIAAEVSDLGRGSAQYDTKCRLKKVSVKVDEHDDDKIGNAIL